MKGTCYSPSPLPSSGGLHMLKVWPFSSSTVSLQIKGPLMCHLLSHLIIIVHVASWLVSCEFYGMLTREAQGIQVHTSISFVLSHFTKSKQITRISCWWAIPLPMHKLKVIKIFCGGKFSLQLMIINKHKSLSCDYRLFIDWPIPVDNN